MTNAAAPTARSDGPAQSYANHRQWYPLYHFFALPILLLSVLVWAYVLYRAPNRFNVFRLIMSIGILTAAHTARVMALRVQDRVIRLEERLRLARLLPSELQSQIDSLSLRQLVGLRFASDAEVPELVRRCLSGELPGANAVKRAVKNWRPDTLRA